MFKIKLTKIHTILMIAIISLGALPYEEGDVFGSEYNLFKISKPDVMKYSVSEFGNSDLIEYKINQETKIGNTFLKKRNYLSYVKSGDKMEFHAGGFTYLDLPIHMSQPYCKLPNITPKMEEDRAKTNSICASKTWAQYRKKGGVPVEILPLLSFRLVQYHSTVPFKFRGYTVEGNTYFMLGPDGKVLYAAKFKSGGCKEFCPVHVKGSIICFDETKKIPCPEGFIPPNDRP